MPAGLTKVILQPLLQSIVEAEGPMSARANGLLAYHRRKSCKIDDQLIERASTSASDSEDEESPRSPTPARLPSSLWAAVTGPRTVMREFREEWGSGAAKVLVWEESAKEVLLCGSFTSPPWLVQLRMLKCPSTRKIWLPFAELFPDLEPGSYQYKFIVDGEWKVDNAGYKARDGDGHVNNVLYVGVPPPLISPQTVQRKPKGWSEPARTVICSTVEEPEDFQLCRREERRSRSEPSQLLGTWSGQISKCNYESCNLPAAVLGLLQSAGSFSRLPVGIQNPRKTSGLRLRCGSFTIPHPSKARSGGADSCFFTTEGAAFGVADGVGEWEWRFRINPRAFADEMMGACGRRAEETIQEETPAELRAQDALATGYSSTSSFGSATALVACLDKTGSKLGVANVGDSGMMHLRRKDSVASSVIGRTNEQQHRFNCPYQLSRLPTEEDFPRLLSEGRTALVNLLKKNPTVFQDSPADADLYTFDLQEGDMLVAGSDGVFDNLFESDISSLCNSAVSPYEANHDSTSPTDPTHMATALAQAASAKAGDRTSLTPFSRNAQRSGVRHTGGKLDDICVVVAWVTRD